MGHVLDAHGHPQEALCSLKKAVQLAPNSIHTHYLIGHSYFLLGDYGNALGPFGETLKMNPNYVAVFMDWVQILEKTGRPIEEIEEMRRKLCDLSPPDCPPLTKTIGEISAEGNCSQDLRAVLGRDDVHGVLHSR